MSGAGQVFASIQRLTQLDWVRPSIIMYEHMATNQSTTDARQSPAAGEPPKPAPTTQTATSAPQPAAPPPPASLASNSKPAPTNPPSSPALEPAKSNETQKALPGRQLRAKRPSADRTTADVTQSPIGTASTTNLAALPKQSDQPNKSEQPQPPKTVPAAQPETAHLPVATAPPPTETAIIKAPIPQPQPAVPV